MGSNPFNYDYSATVANLYDQSIRIPFDIEYHAIVGQKIGRFITPFYILRCLPCFAFNFIAPRIQLPSGIGVILFVFFEPRQIQYAHLEKTFP